MNATEPHLLYRAIHLPECLQRMEETIKTRKTANPRRRNGNLLYPLVSARRKDVAHLQLQNSLQSSRRHGVIWNSLKWNESRTTFFWRRNSSRIRNASSLKKQEKRRMKRIALKLTTCVDLLWPLGLWKKSSTTITPLSVLRLAPSPTCLSCHMSTKTSWSLDARFYFIIKHKQLSACYKTTLIHL